MPYRKPLILLCLLGTINPNVLADLPSPDSSYLDISLMDLMNIKVESASLFKESSLEAAASIQVINQHQWQDFADTSQYDPIEFNTGLNSYSTLFGGKALAIRGYSNFLSVRGISTLIDGIPVNDLIFGSAAYDRDNISLGVLDSIEIIKGPGSTLYGTDAFHGVIAYKTYQADTSENLISGQIGQNGYQQIDLKVSKPFEGHILNLAIDHRAINEYEWPYQNKSINTVSEFNDHRDVQSETQSISLKVRNQKNRSISYQFSLYRNQFDGENFVGGGERFNYLNEDISNGNHSLSLYKFDTSLQLTEHHDIGLKLAYWEVERDNMFEIGSGQFLQEQKISRNQAQIYSQYSSNEFRIYSAIESSLQTVDKARSNNAVQADQGVERKVNSIFSQGRISNILSNTDVELGIRIDDYSDFDQQVTPRFALIHKLAEREVVKAIYGNAFRAAVSLELQGSTAIRGNQNIKPETIDSYEVSWIKQFTKSAVEATAFYTKWKNGIISVPITDPVYSAEYTNIGENTSSGIEFKMTHYIGNSEFQTQYAYVESKNLTDDSDYIAHPKHNVSINLKHTIRSQHTFLVRSLLKDQWRSTGSANNFDTYLRIDTAYIYKLNPSLQTTISIKNIFDIDNKVPSILDRAEGENDIPFTLDLSLRYRF